MRIVMVEGDPRSDRLAGLVRTVCPGATLARTTAVSDGGTGAADLVVVAAGSAAPGALRAQVLAVRARHPDVTEPRHEVGHF